MHLHTCQSCMWTSCSCRASEDWIEFLKRQVGLWIIEIWRFETARVDAMLSRPLQLDFFLAGYLTRKGFIRRGFPTNSLQAAEIPTWPLKSALRWRENRRLALTFVGIFTFFQILAGNRSGCRGLMLSVPFLVREFVDSPVDGLPASLYCLSFLLGCNTCTHTFRRWRVF
jgi:hypothetical protein